LTWANVCPENDIDDEYYSNKTGGTAIPSEERSLRVFVSWKKQWYPCQISAFGTMKDALVTILTELNPPSSESSAIATDEYRLCRLDKNAPGLRIWLNHNFTTYACKINDGVCNQ